MLLLPLFVSMAIPKKVAIPVRVDPRVELFTTVARLAEFGEYTQSSSDSPYARRVDSYFAKFKNHRAIELARKLREEIGIGFDSITSLAVHVADIHTLRERVPFDPIPKRVSGPWTPKAAREFCDALRDFVRDTQYEKFLASEKSYFSTVTGSLETLIEKREVARWLQDFYGFLPKHPPFAIVGMLCGGGNYGVSIEFRDGTTEMSPILGASDFDAGGRPRFGENDLPLILHEFSHGYVNPLTMSHYGRMVPVVTPYMASLKDVWASNAYGDEKSILNETFVRACVQHLSQEHLSPELARANLHEDRMAGFLWTKEVADLLAEYERSRDTFPRFDKFFPRVVERFVATAKDDRILFAKCPKVVSVQPRWLDEVDGKVRVELTIRYSEAMDRKSRGLTIEPEGSEVERKTEFSPDGTSATITLRLAKGKVYRVHLNRFGRSLMSEKGYPLLPYSLELKR